MTLDAFIIFIRYILSVTAVLCAGYSLLLFLEGVFRAPKQGFLTRWQRISLSFITGSGFLSAYLFAVGLLGMSYSIWVLAPFFVVSFVLGAVTSHKRRKIPLIDAPYTLGSNEGKGDMGFGGLSKINKTVFAIIGFLIVIHVSFVIFQAVFMPTYFDDAVHTWNLRAKLLFEHGGLFLDKTSPLFDGPVDSGFQMTSYPLASTLVKIYLSVAAGGFFEPVVNSFGVLIMFSVIGFLFFIILQYSKNYLASIFIPYLIVSLPLGEMHVASGYVDFLFGLIALISVAMLFLWFEKGRKMFYLAVSVFMLGFAGFTKTNPFALFVIPFVLTIVFASLRNGRDALKAVFSLIIGFGMILGPWLAFKGLYPWQIFGVLKFENHIDAFPFLFTVLFAEGNYNIFFFGFMLFLLALVLKKFSTRHLLLIGFILFTMFLLFASFLFSQYGAYLKDQTTFNRAMLSFLPSLIFVVSMTVYDWVKEGRATPMPVSSKNKIKGKK